MYSTQIKNNRILVVVIAVAVAVIFMIISQQASAQVPPAAPAAGSTFEQRVAQRKAERKVVVAEADQKRQAVTCTTAQSKIRTLQQQTTPAIANRAKVNQQVDAKLWIMIGKLKVGEKDTFNLEKQRGVLAEKASAAQQTAANYSQALDDLATINCKADFEGFRALLDTARIYRTQLRDQLTDTRNYINNDIKPSLSEFAQELQAKPSTGGTQ